MRNKTTVLGWWKQGKTQPETSESAIKASIARIAKPVFLLDINNQLASSCDGSAVIGNEATHEPQDYPILGFAPSLPPENLGDVNFRQAFHLKYAYIMGAMANGITSVEMVKQAVSAGMAGFFGAAGLPLDKIETAINQLQQSENNFGVGFNLINNPNNLDVEMAIVQLYLKHKMRLLSASAYIKPSLPLVYYRIKGIYRDENGDIICPNKVIAKVSRVEVAEKFLSPPSKKLIAQLVDKKLISQEQAILALSTPIADALTAEADSGGHTDNRPALALLPAMLALRDKITEKYKYKNQLYVGLGGGIATPDSTSAAFAMGAAYVLTGSVNQSCVESGISETVRSMLAQATQADVAMAPSADMFETGVKVQVLKRGTLFPFRAAKLYDIYRNYDNFESIPEKQKVIIERDFLKRSFQEEWKRTKEFFAGRDPSQLEWAEREPKHKMALVFRSYLGLSSKWAIAGEPSRKADYQIWCGPAIGAFNEWVKGSFLEKPENRKVTAVAMNLLVGACVAIRAHWLRSQNIALPLGAGRFAPIELSQIEKMQL